MIELGQEVKDMISGFKGIAVARHHYLQGCDRISVQPKADKDGKLDESTTFDEPQLIVIGKKKITTNGSRRNGGPMPYRPKPRLTSLR